MDSESSIPISIDGLHIAVVNKDGTVSLGEIEGAKLYEAVKRHNELAPVDPAVFTLLAAVTTQAAVIISLSKEVERLKAKLAQ